MKNLIYIGLVIFVIYLVVSGEGAQIVSDIWTAIVPQQQQTIGFNTSAFYKDW